MKNRLTIILLIFVFVFAAIINKIINERNVQHLGQTFSEIYDDRLLVESYIYQLSELFYKKKIVLLHHSSMTSNDKIETQKQTSEITEIARRYALTKLTENEQQIFEQLSENIERLKGAEARMYSNDDSAIKEVKEICELSFNQLKLLSSIQLQEGNSLRQEGRKVLHSSEIAGRLEWAVYVIILLCVVSVQRKTRLLTNISKQSQLN